MSRETELTDPVLVLNAGSSSLKAGLFEPRTEEQLWAENITWSENGNNVDSHAAALERILSRLDTGRLAAIGHRVVHGGTKYERSVRIDVDVKREIRTLAALAPLHNPAALEIIEATEPAFPGVPQVASFDTAFHATLPPASYLYGVPYEWYERWGIRRFGFHGLSHSYCSRRAAELVGRRLEELSIITCHLGSGCSLAGVKGGKSVATTMGFTPMDGVVMGTRPGSLDPGILLYLLSEGYTTLESLANTLSHGSGLRGLSGTSGDMRAVLRARSRHDRKAEIAFEVFVQRVREAVCAMAAAMGGMDVLVFTAGIGERSPEVREAVCSGLEWAGIEVEPTRNAELSGEGEISSQGSRVRALVVHTREELQVLRETKAIISQAT